MRTFYQDAENLKNIGPSKSDAPHLGVRRRTERAKF